MDATKVDPTATVRDVIAEAHDDPEGFWARAAGDLPWFRRWDRVFDHEPPTFRWFVGGQTNLAYNALDHHVADGRGEQAALIALNERGERRVFTYAQLLHEVEARRRRAARRSASARATASRSTCRPAPRRSSLMLATVRIGAIHSVVFAGFGAQRARRPHRGERLAARLHRRRHVPQGQGRRRSSRSSTRRCAGRPAPVEHVVVLRARGPTAAALRAPARHRRGTSSWRGGDGQTGDARGDGGQRAGVHPRHLGHDGQAEARGPHARRLPGPHRTRWAAGCFGLTPDDVWWATSDIGWIVGHSYIVYAPLIAGCTTVVFEGALDYPQPGRELARVDRGARRDRHLHVADRGPAC